MSVPGDYSDVADVCAAAAIKLSGLVPPPRLTRTSGHLAYRCREKSQAQAIVLKCVAATSRLRASLVLWREGYLQEQGALHRMLDETNEDIWFLALGLIRNQHTPQHVQFLEAFFAEEFGDAADVVSSRTRRNLVPRKKIRAFIASAEGLPDPHRDTAVAETLSAMYSGFVHGAAQHILISYGGSPPHYALSGLQGTPLMEEHLEDAWNYVFRTLQAHQVAARALEKHDLFELLGQQLAAFQHKSGRTG